MLYICIYMCVYVFIYICLSIYLPMVLPMCLCLSVSPYISPYLSLYMLYVICISQLDRIVRLGRWSPWQSSPRDEALDTSALRVDARYCRQDRLGRQSKLNVPYVCLCVYIYMSLYVSPYVSPYVSMSLCVSLCFSLSVSLSLCTSSSQLEPVCSHLRDGWLRDLLSLGQMLGAAQILGGGARKV